MEVCEYHLLGRHPGSSEPFGYCCKLSVSIRGEGQYEADQVIVLEYSSSRLAGETPDEIVERSRSGCALLGERQRRLNVP